MENEAAAEIDPAPVLAAAGWSAAGAFTRVTGGWDALIWRFATADGSAHALRLYRANGDETGSAERAKAEATAIAAAGALGVPVPDVEGSGSWNGAPFMVQRWLPGAPLLQGIERHPWRIWSLGMSFGELQARMHRAAPGDVRVATRAEQLSSAVLPEVAKAANLDWMANAFCHLDYHPLNVLAEGNRISGIVDLGNAAVCDRRADLGYTAAILRAAPLPPGRLNFAMKGGRKVFTAAWRRGYTAEAGRWPLTPPFEALGACILLGNMTEAIAGSRGWATEDDLAPLRAYLRDRMRASGIA